MQRFSDYVSFRQNDLMDYLMDEGEGQQFGGQKFPIPANLAVLLSLVPGGPKFQGQALKYVMTDALYRAAKGREAMAKSMSSELGRPVKEYEVFSPEVHAKDPQLAALWEEMKDSYFEHYEPKHIKINMGGNIGETWLSIPKFNEVLKQHGLPPFHFGGTDGLVEKMESGRGWVKDRPSIDAPHGEGEAHQRFGIDLSHPRLHRYADKPHEPRVAFGHSPNMGDDKRAYREPGWEPSLSSTYYTERLAQSLKRMSDKAERAMAGLPDGDPHKEQLGQILGTVGKGLARAPHQIEDDTFNNKSTDTVYFDDPHAYEAIKRKVLEALQAYNNIPDEQRNHVGRTGDSVPLRKLQPEEIEQMMSKLFNDEEMSVQQRLSSFPPYRDAGKQDKFLVSSLLNWYQHNKIQVPKNAGLNPHKGAFNPMTVSGDLKGVPDMFERPIAKKTPIEGGLSPEILNHMYPDYFPLDQTEGDLEGRIAGFLPFTMTNGEDEISFSYDKKNKKWSVSQPTGATEKHPNLNWATHQKSPVVLPGNDEMGFLKPHKFDHVPLFGANREKWMAVWDKFANLTGGDRAQEADIVKRKAASQVRGRGGDADFDMFKDDAGDAFEAFERIMGSPKFFFGEMGPHFAKILADNHFEEHEAQEITKHIEQMLAKGEIPSPENLGHEGKAVYDLLLKNGKGWRIGAAAHILSGNISQIKKVRGKERTGVGSANKEGDVSDVMSTASDNAAAARLAAGGEVGAAKGKLNRAVSGRSVLGPTQKADISTATGHVGDSGVYRKEGEASVGPTNKPAFDELYDRFHGTFKSSFKPNDMESLWGINAQINKLQNAHHNGDVVRSAGNAAVMDVLHDAIKGYASTIDKDSSKRALAQIMFNMFANPEGGLKDILTGDEEETSSVDTQPLIHQIQPIVGKDAAMKKYFMMLQKGDSLESLPPVEEKPLKVVGQPTQAPAKPTLGGTSGGGLGTTVNPQQSFTFNNATHTRQSIRNIYQGEDLDFLNQVFPHDKLAQLPEDLRREIMAYRGNLEKQHLQKAESLISIDSFLTMLRETDAIFDGSKPTTFNWWGAVGDPLGKVIDGDVPVKKKKKHARK